MLSEDDLERGNVVNFINDEFDEDIKSLQRARDVALRLEQTIKSIERKVSVSLTDESDASLTPYKLAQLLQSSESALIEAKSLLDRKESIRSQVEAHVSQTKTSVEELEPKVKEIKELEKCVRYLQWIQVLTALSDNVNDSMKATKCDQMKTVSQFVKLSELCNRIQRTSCLHVKNFANESTIRCHKMLKDRFSKELCETLKLMKWPFIPSPPPGHFPTPTYDVLSRFETTFCLLLDIQLPDLIGASTSSNNDDSDWNLLLPLQLLFRPFRLRFVYHFSGNKKTNCLSKPEWYFTQVLSWIRGHVPYLDMFIQPVLNRAGQVRVKARIELMHYLMELVVKKVASDIEATLTNEVVLAHIINETLIFEKEMRSYGYPTGLPSVLSVLTKDNCFSKWLELEKELAMDHMDKMLSTETMWIPLCQDQSDIDDNKVPEFAEKFVTIIMSITDRYRYLIHPGNRLQFLHLQLDLLDDFRVRLLQLLREEAKDTITSNFCAILNAVYYIANVLKDWSDMPFFLQMQYYKLRFKLLCANTRQRQQSVESYTGKMRHSNSQSLNSNDYLEIDDEIKAANTSIHSVESNEVSFDCLQDGIDENTLDSIEGTVFEDIVGLLEHMKEEMIKTITDHVIMEVKAKSYHFKHEKWFSLPSLKEYVNPTLSPSACRMFMVLTSSLKSLRDSLALPLFNTTWQIVAKELDDFFYEEVLLMNQFNEGGAAQFSFDTTRNLFPIFVEYTRHPENHFKKIKESCILLNLNVGSAMLLQEALTTDNDQLLDEHHSNPIKALEEIGVYKLTIKDAVNVLKLRTDLNTYR